MSVQIKMNCKKHPTYMGVRIPKVSCIGCDWLFSFRMTAENYIKGGLKNHIKTVIKGIKK